MASGWVMRAAVAALMLGSATAAAAVDFDYECDVPPNRLSAVDHPFSAAPIEISGTIAPVIARVGRYSPRAGVRIFNGDESMSVGFQLVSREKMVDGKKIDDGFDVFQAHIVGGTPRRTIVGKIPPGQTQFAFSVALAADGTGSFAIGPVKGAVALTPFTSGKTRTFCTAGQFGFKGVKTR